MVNENCSQKTKQNEGEPGKKVNLASGSKTPFGILPRAFPQAQIVSHVSSFTHEAHRVICK